MGIDHTGGHLRYPQFIPSQGTCGLKPAMPPLNVMVIGGGIAGMEAARVAAVRGHRVSLYEKGGALQIAPF